MGMEVLRIRRRREEEEGDCGCHVVRVYCFVGVLDKVGTWMKNTTTTTTTTTTT